MKQQSTKYQITVVGHMWVILWLIEEKIINCGPKYWWGSSHFGLKELRRTE